MLLTLLVASLSRCASTQSCPTNTDLITALEARDNEIVYSMSAQVQKDNPNDIMIIHTMRIKSVDDVVCGDALPSDRPGGPSPMNCKFSVRYWDRNAYTVAKLVRRPDGWQIVDALAVTRKRR